MRDPQGRLGIFRPGARPDPATPLKLIDEHQDRFGAEPVLRELHIPASTYYRWRRAESCNHKLRAELTERSRGSLTARHGRCIASSSAMQWRITLGRMAVVLERLTQ